MSHVQTPSEAELMHFRAAEVEEVVEARKRLQRGLSVLEARNREFFGIPADAVATRDDWHVFGFVAIHTRFELPPRIVCGNSEAEVWARVGRLRPGPNGPIDGLRFVRRDYVHAGHSTR